MNTLPAPPVRRSTTGTMHAAVVEQFGERLVLRTVDVPGRGEILVKTEACGVCHGRVRADIEYQPLSAINAVFDRLAHGDVPSRVVLTSFGA